jgi:PII-like signaling protein
VTADCLKLTTYFGERDRCDGRFLADALLDLYGRHELQASVLLRGAEGFGIKQRHHTERLLSLSEDLPLVTVAVDTRERIERVLPTVTQLAGSGLVTLERARMVTDLSRPVDLPEELQEATKLTVYVGRQERIGGRPAHLAVVDLLHRRGVAGATAMLGVDGTAHGRRERAAFFGRNAEVPVMIISVGDGERIAAVLPELGELLARPLATLERVRVCKRDGARLGEPRHLPETDDAGLEIWQKLVVYTSEQSKHDGHPFHTALVRALREREAGGATVLRGFWGYHGDHAPHGDRFWSLHRHVPMVTVIIDRPERARRWFEVVDAMTAEAGLVTSEMVPALHAPAAPGREGGPRLAG